MDYTLAALTFIRGIVRPVAVLAIIGAVIGFAAIGSLEAAKFVAAFGAPTIGFWFAERSHRNKDRAG